MSDMGSCRWTRNWIAEEKRHGDLLNKYCHLSGRVDFKVRLQAEQTNDIGSAGMLDRICYLV